MDLDLKTEQDVLVVRVLSARMYAVDASSFREQMLAEVDAGNADILFDLSAVQYIDSTSQGALVSVLKRVGNAGRVLIASPSEEVRRMFSLTRMDKVFGIFESRVAGLAAFSS